MKPVIIPFFIAHQGCPHQCVFCNQVKITGGSESIPTPADITAKIEKFQLLAPDRKLEIAFYGGSFTCLPQRVQEELLRPLSPLLHGGVLTSVRISTRPDAIDADTARYLRGMGVRTVELGIQSMDDTVLAKSGRGHTSADVEKAFSLLSRSGLNIGAQIMPGLPGDTHSLSIATIRKVVALHPDFMRIYPVLVLAGTELERLYRLGVYEPLELFAAVGLCKVLLHEAMRASVPVIRIGLQPSDELDKEGSIIAGPYHPAFRQLVEGELFFDLLVRLTEDIPSNEAITVSCPIGRTSEVVGQHRRNLLRLKGQRGISVLSVSADPAVLPLELHVNSSKSRMIGSILDLHYGTEGVF